MYGWSHTSGNPLSLYPPGGETFPSHEPSFCSDFRRIIARHSTCGFHLRRSIPTPSVKSHIIHSLVKKKKRNGSKGQRQQAAHFTRAESRSTREMKSQVVNCGSGAALRPSSSDNASSELFAPGGAFAATGVRVVLPRHLSEITHHSRAKQPLLNEADFSFLRFRSHPPPPLFFIFLSSSSSPSPPFPLFLILLLRLTQGESPHYEIM